MYIYIYIYIYSDAKLVKAGRVVEMDYFKSMGVYERVPRSEQLETKGKVIGTKWIDTNKGDFENPNIRCRLVGKEFGTGPDDALFASTPPLEALRLIVRVVVCVFVRTRAWRCVCVCARARVCGHNG